MIEIEVLGSGCAKCVKTAKLIQEMADESGAEVHVVKETNPKVMLQYKVMSTPAVVVNHQLVHSGSIPERTKIAAWLK